ncbi:LOW QUALITY PROTEIN: ribonucleoprotein PTB-binding 2 [Alosa sapidissima]|uniref:LOW QUALITY PROTEIN: ribonucleoprotein PTB-binding 2 n=1 Tax=Alosa sapidissima TaxID=34773 RepID=UPI001C09C23A|nr:LOW QUALITY PROTEIN: ribonucleoprotein PTB-binding 2 [Alosa sapidissima]
MAAASSIQPPSVHAIKQENSPFPDSDSPESRQDEDAPSEGTSLRDMPDLDPEEIERRLEKTNRELSNRRKILIKNLPQDTTNQEVHDILKEYELKYCFVDRNKGTAFVTLLNGEQAQHAISSLHQSSVRGRLISVQLQPTDSLLCVANLPHTLSAEAFHQLVRSHGNVERCFLVHSPRSGHSKGYGFVEYMKKDSASRARSELLGRALGERSLVVQWTDANQLIEPEQLHSRCLCIDRLPLDFDDTEELARVFSQRYRPVFCQLAQDEGSPVRGFAVVEYETSEQAECALLEMDRTLIQGQEVRLSLCAPGTSGRSTLAALIAAQGVMLSSKKGLLPEPSLAQLLNSMTNPAALQVLMRPYHTGKRGGKFGRPHNLPFLRPPLTAALLQLGKVQQSTMLGNGLVLQNLLHMQLAQQQLLQIKDKHITNVSSLLGDPSRLLLHKALGLRAPAAAPAAAAPMALGKGLLGDSPTEESAPVAPQAPHLHGQHGTLPVCPDPPRCPARSGAERRCGQATAPEKQPAPPGTTGSAAAAQPQLQSFLSGMSSPSMGPLLAATAPKAASSLHGTHTESSSTLTSQLSSQTSLLGEPPKEVKLPSNPYLNLASVLPGAVLQAAPSSSKAQAVATHSVGYSSVMPPTSHPSTQYSTDAPADYTQQYSQPYSQEAMQQWYQHYQTQNYSSANQEATAVSEYSKEQPQATATTSYGDYSSYMQAVSHYYTQTQMNPAAVQAYQHRDAAKESDVVKASLGAGLNGSAQTMLPAAVLPAYSALPMMPGFISAPHATPIPVTLPQTAAATTADWNQYYYAQARGQKREYPQLPVPEVASDGPYVGQHSQGLGGQYADYFKKKRI